MRFCFILEEKYANEPMPMVVADQLHQWGHEIDVLQPFTAVTNLTDLSLSTYDAYVLKTVSEGPGLTLLEAAEAVGIPTINNSRAIRLVRDKAVAVAFAKACGLPVPPTYFVGHPRTLVNLPHDIYPVVIKPTTGSSMQGVHLVRTPQEMARLRVEKDTYYLAMRYVENTGYDIKLYVTGQEVHAIVKGSVLHGPVIEREIPTIPEMLSLARNVGRVFGLDLYGVDVLQTAEGLMLVDINDFPSFGRVPRHVFSIAEYILHAAYRSRLKREKHAARPSAQRHQMLQRQDSVLVPAQLIERDPQVRRARLEVLAPRVLNGDHVGIGEHGLSFLTSSGVEDLPTISGLPATSTPQPVAVSPTAESAAATPDEAASSQDSTKVLSLFAIARTTLEEDNRAFVHKVYSIEAGISQNQPEGFEGKPFDLPLHSSVEFLFLDISLHTSSNIELISHWQERLRYDSNNPEPQFVAFKFKVVAPGSCSLTIDFHYERRWLRTIHFEFDAVEQSQLTAISSEE